MLIPPPSCSHDNTFSSGEESELFKEGIVGHHMNENQLNEDDFPMT